MWFATLLTSGATSFGRLVMTVLIPNALPVFTLWALLRAHSFTGTTMWNDVLPAATASDAFAVLLAIVAIAVLAALVQPFQVRVVRLLEGYWEGWSATARIAPFFVEFQRRRMVRLWEREEALFTMTAQGAPTADGLGRQAAALREQARTAAALSRVRQRILRYPEPPVVGFHLPGEYSGQEPVPLLPTALGNALRTGERSAGERYRLNTIASWPRIYPLLSTKLAEVCDAARDAVDTAANLTVSFFLTTVLATAGLCHEPIYYWIPLTTLALTCLSYTGSIAAAMRFGTCLQVAYDLHRFDMLKAMHYRLPRTRDEERADFTALSKFLTAPSAYNRQTLGLAGSFDAPEYKHD